MPMALRQSSPFSVFWKRKFLFVFVVKMLLLLQVLVFWKFSHQNRLQKIILSNFATQSETSTNVSGVTATCEKTGNLNLHIWYDVCARNFNTSCSFPLFPKAPDVRILVDESLIAPNEKIDTNSSRVLRIFGFLTPKYSGRYSFMVTSCDAEVWLRENASYSKVRQVFNNDRMSTEKRNSRVSSEIDLKARRKYFLEVVASCRKRRKKLQLLWRTPKSASFRLIDPSTLSHYYNDSYLKHLKSFEDTLPDSPACAARRHKKLYFHDHRVTTYISHDIVKDILPYYTYKPSYTVEHEVGKYQAVTRHVVHTFVYPFPEHPNLRDEKHWIFPLDEEEALSIVNRFVKYLDKAKPGKFQLEKVLRVERKTDKKRGKRFFLDLKLRDCTTNKSVGFSEYIFVPFQSNQLYYPTNFQWRKNAPVYLVVTAKNLGRWLHHFIKNMEAILKETGDSNLHFVICDYNGTDINLDEVLKQSSLRNYAVLRKRGHYSRTASFNDAISLVKDPQSIIFLLDLHLDIASSLIDDIRKHCIEGRMFYTPIVIQLACGANPANLAGKWQVYGYGLIGMYKSDWDRAGGFPVNSNKWGGEDWDLVDALFGKGLEFERSRTRHVYHYYHTKKGMW